MHFQEILLRKVNIFIPLDILYVYLHQAFFLSGLGVTKCSSSSNFFSVSSRSFRVDLDGASLGCSHAVSVLSSLDLPVSG